MTQRIPERREAGGPAPLFTVGHSTRTIEAFVALLQRYGIERLIDVRTIARSRHNPQFEASALEVSLPAAGIEYLPMPSLGGLRHTRRDSPNGAWRNASFRGYADYMQSPEFAEAIDALVARSAERVSAIMCAEAVPWRCHRSLIADALVVRGIPVEEILSETSHRPHSLTPFAHVEGECVTCPKAPETDETDETDEADEADEADVAPKA